MNMNKRDLKKLSKSELINVLLKQKKSKKVCNHEDLLDNDPFKNEVPQKPARRIPKPTSKPPPPILQVEEKEHITDVPSSKIKELKRAHKNHAKSYKIELHSKSSPFAQFIKTKELVESHLDNLLKTMKEFKFVETLVVTFEKLKIVNEKPISIYRTAYFNSNAKMITKVHDIEPKLRMSGDEISNKIDKWISEGSGQIIDQIESHYINVTLYRLLNGSS